MSRALASTAALLVLLCVPATADGYRLLGGRWATPTIGYYTETRAYSWSVDTAAYAWNTSGAHVRFVKTSKAQANVLVGVRWYKHAGDAHVIRVGNRIVGAQVGLQQGHDRYELALIVAHEFGHVLGLDHEFSVCATMNPSIGDDHTTLCPAPPPGMWTCRLLQPDDVRGAIRLYGGAVRPWHGSSFCPR
ncbi:MAG TPA: matrixin family metalloprotease [Gaiellaceae bacterium]|nr:matrixin family metalloprotease [Gaiellaceae bacterium]